MSPIYFENLSRKAVQDSSWSEMKGELRAVDLRLGDAISHGFRKGSHVPERSGCLVLNSVILSLRAILTKYFLMYSNL